MSEIDLGRLRRQAMSVQEAHAAAERIAELERELEEANNPLSHGATISLATGRNWAAVTIERLEQFQAAEARADRLAEALRKARPAIGAAALMPAKTGCDVCGRVETHRLTLAFTQEVDQLLAEHKEVSDEG